MTYKVYIHGYANPISDCMTWLEEDGIVDIKHWVTHKGRGTKSFIELYSGMYEDNDVNLLELGWYEEFYNEVMPIFFEVHSRHSHYSSQHLEYYHYADLFNKAARYCYHSLQDIDIVIFSNIPHESYEIILYYMANVLGIRTVMTHQSPFKNRFFYMSHPDEMSDLLGVEELPKHIATGNLEWDPPNKKPFYMGLINNLFSSNHKEYAQYRKLMNSNIQLCDLNCKYIYVPLHEQPELTTSVLSYGLYSDPLMLVEDVSKRYPDCTIYVKDHPKQTHYRRGYLFFERLKRFKNVKLIDPSLSSYDLIKNCYKVATVTGTAGWEAYQLGKGVDIYGMAWYTPLVQGYKLSDLEKRLGTGIVDVCYSSQVDGYDTYTNNTHLYEFFKSIL